ncbi:MAG: type II toxin-antitoxin system RelE/ParE family toxin [Candidatus Nanohaloarchaea archaeon]
MVEITSEAKKDLKEFELEAREGLLDKIEERLENDRDQDNISYINKPQFGIEFHRLKLIEDGFNHRIYFDFIDSELTVFAVRHRDYAYSQEDLKEIEKRLRTMNTD